MHENIDNYCNNLKKELVIIELVKSVFPDAKMQTYYNHYDGKKLEFQSKMFNKDFDKCDFVVRYNEIHLNISKTLLLGFNGKVENIVVHSQPKGCKILGNNYDYKTKKRSVVIQRGFNNLKRAGFSDEIIQEARVQIVNFIHSHPDMTYNSDKLEKKLKNLLLFV
jgi:hypothetical protein